MADMIHFKSPGFSAHLFVVLVDVLFCSGFLSDLRVAPRSRPQRALEVEAINIARSARSANKSS